MKHKAIRGNRGNGKPANPYAYPVSSNSTTYFGMTLRDHFAGIAMQGLISNFKGDVSTNYEILSITSYKMADAMLKERCIERSLDTDDDQSKF